MADLSNVKFDPQNPDALFSPDQWSNQFSLFNNNALPWPGSYAGYPTDAMGNPIAPQAGSGIPTQAQVQARQAAPAQSALGTTINSTPAAAAGGQGQNGLTPAQISYLGPQGSAINELLQNYGAAQAKLSPQQLAIQNQNNAMRQQMLQQQDTLTAAANQGGGFGRSPGGAFNPGSSASFLPQMQAAPQQAAPPAAAAPGGLTYPQVLALLANPGKVTTPGADVPAGPSAQPAGGVNNAFLGQAQGKPGMNQNFLSALAALQNRGRG